MSEAHPKLKFLLHKHGITLEEFHKQGRPKRHVKLAREAIVTELHESGMTWNEMAEITGKSTSFIQRNTKAVGNPASHRNRVENARKVGRSRAGEKKPWLSKAMKRKWYEGDFDFHIGRVRPEEEKKALKEAWKDPTLRQEASDRLKSLWEDPQYRQNLLQFHRSEEERVRRSRAQTLRLLQNPSKWSRGQGGYVTVTKCSGKSRIWVRSSYEEATVHLLESDPTVCSFEYEPRFELECGRWILPDFLITYKDGSKILVEVKASWVLSLPADSKKIRRLEESRRVAASKGWFFEIWPEKTRLAHVV